MQMRVVSNDGKTAATKLQYGISGKLLVVANHPSVKNILFKQTYTRYIKSQYFSNGWHEVDRTIDTIESTPYSTTSAESDVKITFLEVIDTMAHSEIFRLSPAGGTVLNPNNISWIGRTPSVNAGATLNVILTTDKALGTTFRLYVWSGGVRTRAPEPNYSNQSRDGLFHSRYYIKTPSNRGLQKLQIAIIDAGTVTSGNMYKFISTSFPYITK